MIIFLEKGGSLSGNRLAKLLDYLAIFKFVKEVSLRK